MRIFRNCGTRRAFTPEFPGRILLAGLFCLCFGGCLSLTESAGRALDGSAFAEKRLALYSAEKGRGAPAGIEVLELRNRAGERSLVISLKDFPAVKIRGTAPAPDGSFYLVSLHYLGGSVSGWNEFTLDLSGFGKFSPVEGGAVLSIPEKPEPVRISEGKIRRFDSRITGGEALSGLGNRRERILSLCEWMRGRPDAPAGAGRGGFEKFWKPVLLPELVSAKKRPAEWPDAETAAWVWAEDLRWNTAYTDRVFPEALRAVRNSGTLLRDWEEAFEWIYFEYEWESVVKTLSGEIFMQRKK
ncbi:MAG: hypothetical protein LBP27_00830 [Treponema sp.]|jgi:hypothetical protein|nr:hypothetical protein [Treponema sp.]